MSLSTWRGSRRVVITIAVTVAGLGFVGLVIASPWLLRAIAGDRSSWSDVGNIGQAYGGAAAILAGMAFVGVLASLWLQWHSAGLQRAAIARERHFELTKLAFEYPILARIGVLGGNDITDDEALICRRANLWLSYWLWLWTVGDLTETALRRHLRTEIFIEDCVVSWWARVQELGGWTSGNNRKSIRFEKIVNEEYERLRMRCLRPESETGGKETSTATGASESDLDVVEVVVEVDA